MYLKNTNIGQLWLDISGHSWYPCISMICFFLGGVENGHFRQ